MIQDHRIGDAQTIHIAHHHAQTLTVDVVGHQRSGGFHVDGQLGRLIARRRTQIQDPLSRLRIQKMDRHHGDFFLDVDMPGDIGKRLAGTGFVGHLESAGIPTER